MIWKGKSNQWTRILIRLQEKLNQTINRDLNKINLVRRKMMKIVTMKKVKKIIRERIEVDSRINLNTRKETNIKIRQFKKIKKKYKCLRDWKSVAVNQSYLIWKEVLLAWVFKVNIKHKQLKNNSIGISKE